MRRCRTPGSRRRHRPDADASTRRRVPDRLAAVGGTESDDAKTNLPGDGRDAVPRGVRQGRSARGARNRRGRKRSEEHTSELQSLMRITYAVFCLKKKTIKSNTDNTSIVIQQEQLTKT